MSPVDRVPNLDYFDIILIFGFYLLRAGHRVKALVRA
jgi:hypothetical protein